MERFYYQKDENFNCTQPCCYSCVEESNEEIIYIGSGECKLCAHNVAFDFDEHWIKCDVYSSFLELGLMHKKVNDLEEQLKNQSNGK